MYVLFVSGPHPVVCMGSVLRREPLTVLGGSYVVLGIWTRSHLLQAHVKQVPYARTIFPAPPAPNDFQQNSSRVGQEVGETTVAYALQTGHQVVSWSLTGCPGACTAKRDPSPNTAKAPKRKDRPVCVQQGWGISPALRFQIRPDSGRLRFLPQLSLPAL